MVVGGEVLIHWWIENGWNLFIILLFYVAEKVEASRKTALCPGGQGPVPWGARLWAAGGRHSDGPLSVIAVKAAALSQNLRGDAAASF